MRKAAQAKSADPVTMWLESGRKLRSDLLSEKASLAARLKEIDAALMRLAAADATIEEPTPAPRIEERPKLSSMTIEQAIISAVAAHPEGASVAQIRDWMTQGGKRFEPKHLSSYLYKMKKDELLDARGEKGSRTYILSPSATGAEGH